MRPTDRTGIAVIVSVALACLTVRPLTEDGSFLALSWLLIGLIGGIGIALRRSRFGGATVLAAQSVGLVLFSLGLSGLTPIVGLRWFENYAGPVGARHRAHAHPGLADGTQRRRTADLRHGGRNHHDHDRPAGQRSQPARVGAGAAGDAVPGSRARTGHRYRNRQLPLHRDRLPGDPGRRRAQHSGPLDARAVPGLGRRIRHSLAGGLAGRRLSRGAGVGRSDRARRRDADPVAAGLRLRQRCGQRAVAADRPDP